MPRQHHSPASCNRDTAMRIGLRLSVALCALLIALPPLPQAYGGPQPGQSMSSDGITAVLPDAQINLGIPSGSVDVRKYGAVCDGVTNVVAAVDAAVAAGALKVFLPANCLYKPTANTTPTGVEIVGEDWKTSTISVADRATDNLSMGPRAIFRNVAIISKFCDEDPNPALTAKVCPVGYAANISDSANTIHNWVYQSVWVTSGTQVTGPTSVVSTDIPNAAYVTTAPGADAVYLQSGGAASSAARVVTAGANAIGLYVLNGFGDAANDHTGLWIKEFSSNGGTVSKSSLYIARASATGGVATSLYIGDSDSGGNNTSPLFDSVVTHQTSGNLHNVYHATSTFTGDVLQTNMGNSSGTFSGNFFNHTVAGSSKIKGAADGTIDIATGATYKINNTTVLSGTGLGTGILASSLTSTGTLTGGATGAGFTLDFANSTLSGSIGTANGGTGSTASTARFIQDSATNVSTRNSSGNPTFSVTGTAGTPTAYVTVQSGGASIATVYANGSSGVTGTLQLGIAGQAVNLVGDFTPSANYKVNSSTLSKTSDTAFATVPGLTVALAAGKTYSCKGYLTVTGAGASGGIKVTLANADTLTATSISMTASNFNGATTNARSTATALGSAIGAATAVSTDVNIDAAIVVNAAGTIALQAAQNGSDGTATVVGINSSFQCVRVT
jgi:hypothetical protein